jgi:hypothetical protein
MKYLENLIFSGERKGRRGFTFRAGKFIKFTKQEG